MSRLPLPLTVGDVSAFAKNLRNQLDGMDHAPSHVEMLNCIARAGGWRNFQHLRAEVETAPGAGASESPAADAAMSDEAASELLQPEASASQAPVSEAALKRIKRGARLFDGRGRLTTWPKKHSLRLLCLWGLWSQLPAKATFNEREISDWLEQRHDFGDYALLRRFMVDLGLVARTADGRTYLRLEVEPPAEAREMIRAISH